MNRHVKLIGCVAAALGMAQFAQGAAMYTTNFDAMTPGSINGQEGWLAASPLFNQSVTTAGPGIGGTQAWQRSNTYTDGTFGDQPFSHQLTGEGAGESTVPGSPPNRIFTYSVQFKAVNPTADNSSVSLSAADYGGGARMNYARLDYNPGTGLSVSVDDATDNTFGSPATFNEYQIATNLDPSVYHTLTVSTIFNDGPSNDVTVYSIDGVNSAAIGSWEDYYRNDPEQLPNGNVLTGVDSVLFRTGSQLPGGVAGAGGFYFDNFSESAVPEPASLGLFAIGGLFLARRSRRKSVTA
jgi:hypothetical protein